VKVKIKRELIKQLRNEKSWTQEEFAEVCGLHSRTVQRMENEGSVSVKTLNIVANALEIEPYCLEFSTDEIDFGPLYTELRLLTLAITRKMLPLDKRKLPNSLVAVLTLVSFSASYTLLHSLMLIANQPEASFDNPAYLGVFGLTIIFSLVYIGVIYPLFQLKSWARLSMLIICWLFFVINGGLLFIELISITREFNYKYDFSSLFEYSINILIVFWIYKILTRPDIRRLFSTEAKSTSYNNRHL